MSEDKQAQAEAYIRKKPKRVIQNQTLIVLLLIIVAPASWTVTVLTLWLMFNIPFAIPSLIVVWAVSTIIYMFMRIHVHRQNKKS